MTGTIGLIGSGCGGGRTMRELISENSKDTTLLPIEYGKNDNKISESIRETFIKSIEGSFGSTLFEYQKDMVRSIIDRRETIPYTIMNSIKGFNRGTSYYDYNNIKARRMFDYYSDIKKSFYPTRITMTPNEMLRNHTLTKPNKITWFGLPFSKHRVNGRIVFKRPGRWITGTVNINNDTSWRR